MRSLFTTPALLFGLLASPAAAQAPVDTVPPLPPLGRLVDVGGWRLHLHCTGEARQGVPTVILEAGAGDFSPEWSLVQPGVAEFARVCSYDRADEGWSDMGPHPRTMRQIVYELHTLLERAGERAPYVLVGHSFGGPVARLYASTHPSQVAGMVLIDGGSDDPWRMQGDGSLKRSSELVTGAAVPPVKTSDPVHAADIPARILTQLEGLARQLGPTANEGPRALLPADAQRMRTWAYWQVKHWAQGDNPFEHEELAALRALRTGSEHPLGDLPLVVIRRGVQEDDARLEGEHRAIQEAAARMSRRGRVVVAERSGHHVQLQQPELVVAAIREVLTLARPSASFVPVPAGATPEEVVRLAASVTPSARQLAWQGQEMTAFLHFGINTFTDREWGDGTESPALFNPTQLDARQWMRTLRDAGVRLVILTAKHHDGFCLWPSRFTEHSVKNSPWRNGQGDVVREVAEAAREYGLKFGVYLSPWDRNAPSYGDSPRYNEFFKNQLRELLTGYGPIDEVWFDGAKGDNVNQEYDWVGYYSLVRELQPEAVIAVRGPDVRWVGTESGYGRETEWSVVGAPLPEPALASAGILMPPIEPQDPDLGGRDRLRDARALFWYPSEVDVSIRPGWFYHASQDAQVKSLARLVDIYYSSIGRNSVLLLNVPPDRRGLIHENDAGRLRELRRVVDETFARDLAAGARVEASSAAQAHPAAAMLDADGESYWMAAEGDTAAVLTLDLGAPATFNRLLLQEEIRVGQRVERFALEGWDGSRWQPLAQGTTVGYKRLLRFPLTTTARVRLRIERARLSPTLSALGLYRAPEVLSDPAIRRDREGLVTLATESTDPVIVYTLDGSEPTAASTRYTAPFPLPRGGVVRARAFVEGMREGSATVERRFDLAKTAWRVVSASDQAQGMGAARAIDENRGTMWHTTWQNNTRPHPHELVIDLGETLTLQGFTYLPRQDGNPSGTVYGYAVHVSEDGRSWGEPAAQGAFENVLANPIEQSVRFRAPARGRYLRFVARTPAVAGETWASAAEIGVITR